MSPNPASFLRHLSTEGYHPRSDKHSNALAEAIVRDLVENCRIIRERGQAGELVYDFNFTLTCGTADWNVDLVLGSPAIGPPAKLTLGSNIARQKPATVSIAVEIKSVMTEHRKAVKNRKRDLEAHHEHVHNYDERAIAGGVLVINASPSFVSPLRTTETVHRNPDKLVEHCVSQLRGVAMRGGPRRYGLDAACAIVVSHANVDGSASNYITSAPAPLVGDPIHYDAFILALCEKYRRQN